VPAWVGFSAHARSTHATRPEVFERSPMKSTTTTSSSARSPARAMRASTATSTYLSPEQTRALLASSLAARTERLQAGDMLTTDEAAVLASTTRVTINAWIAKGRAIGLTQTRRGYRLPRWQFEPALWAAVPELANALGTTEGWSLLSFLESPHGGLKGLTPRQALERGDTERVLKLARAEGT
jgi:excisionase family DNA binding protein